MLTKRKNDKYKRITAYVPESTYDKMVSYMCHNAIADGGRPQMVGYGAISNTITDAINSHCVIGYEYSLMSTEIEEPTGPVSIPVFIRKSGKEEEDKDE